MKEEMIGKQFTTRNSGVCVITKYVGCNEVHIKFLDTNFERVTDMNSLRKGYVKDASLSKTIKKYEVGKEDIVGKTFENNKGQKYVVLEKISTTKFNIKFVDSGYETTVNKISIEIGSIKDSEELDRFKSFLGEKLNDERFGTIVVTEISSRKGEKILVCENLDNTLKFLLTEAEVVSGDLSRFGKPPVVLEYPLPITEVNGNTKYNDIDFDKADFKILNAMFYVDNNELYHRLVRKDSVPVDVLPHKTYLAGRLAGFYPEYNIDNAHVMVFNVPFFVNDVKSVLTGEVNSCQRRKFKESEINAQGLQQEYSIWSNMRNRCNKGYALLSEDFSDFWGWIAWAKEQKGFMCRDLDGNIFQMESDLFSQEKTYSPDTVVFVPNSINQMCKPNKRSSYPKGIQFFPDREKPYRAYGVEFGNQVHLGYHYEIDEALLVVRDQRKSYVKKLKEVYGKDVEDKVFEALLEDRWFE